MGWEVRRGGRLYLYRNHRVGGVPVKEYLAADDRVGFGEMTAYQLGRLRRRGAKLRKLRRQTRAEYRGRIDDLLCATASANADLRVLADGTLYALGFHRHKREWRMKRQLAQLKQAIAA